MGTFNLKRWIIRPRKYPSFFMEHKKLSFYRYSVKDEGCERGRSMKAYKNQKLCAQRACQMRRTLKVSARIYNKNSTEKYLALRAESPVMQEHCPRFVVARIFSSCIKSKTQLNSFRNAAEKIS